MVKSKKIYKFLIVLFLILAIVVPFFMRCSRYSNSYDFEISKYSLNAVLDEYGDLHVIEKVTNEYNNRNTVFYKNLIYGKNNSFSTSKDKSQLIKDVRVIVEDDRGIVFDTTKNNNSSSRFVGYSYNNDIDERGDYIRCETNVANCAMIFYYDSKGISKKTTFSYEYTIQGVVTEYGDISEFNWVMLGYQPMNVNNVEIKITLPKGNYDIKDMNTFFHGTSMATRTFTSTNEILITTDKLVYDEQIEVRLLLNKDVFSSIRSNNKTSINRLDDILSFEREQEQTAKFLYNYYYIIIILFVVCLIGIAIMTVNCYKKYDKEYKSEFYNEYYRELPADYPPAVMGYLYKFREIDDGDLTATLLDLIRKKYLILENPSDNVNDDNPNYKIKLNKDKSLDSLTKLEKHLIDWYIGEIGNGEEVYSSDLNDYSNNYTNAQAYQKNNKKWSKLVSQEAAKYNFFDNNVDKAKSRYMATAVVGIIMFFVLIVLGTISGFAIGHSLGFSLLFVVLAFIFYLNSIDKRSVKGNEDYVRWKAFKKFLEEFSTFEDYPVPSLIIWEHYLVYATSFGIASKVMKQLKLKFTDNDFENDCPVVITYGYRYNYYRSINRSVSNIHAGSTATIASHNSSRGGGFSGGGFSGGSSFGGGGGSFGGR